MAISIDGREPDQTNGRGHESCAVIRNDDDNEGSACIQKAVVWKRSESANFCLVAHSFLVSITLIETYGGMLHGTTSVWGLQ